MSKIDASVEESGHGSFALKYGDKIYGFFTTRAGALAHLEALENDRLINSSETETLSKLHGVLQSPGDKGGDKS